MGDLHGRVVEHLEAARATYRVRAHAEMTVDIGSPLDFAEALGYPLGRITKTLFCRSRPTGIYVAIVGPMDARIDFKGVAMLLDCGRLESAKPEDLESVTGYPRGGVSPLGLGDQVTVAVVRESLSYPTILVGGGALGVEVEIDPRELIRVTHAVVTE